MNFDELKLLINQKIKDIDLRVYSINYEKENNNNFLRIIIDKDGIVDLDDCVNATNIINVIVDELDMIEESYILDVSSRERGKNNG